MDLALSYQGRRKLVRHLSTTRVGEIIELQPSLAQATGKPLVAIDAEGFEIGREMPLSFLVREPGQNNAGNGLLELTVRADDWGL